MDNIIYLLFKLTIAFSSYTWPVAPLPDVYWVGDQKYITIDEAENGYAHYYDGAIHLNTGCTKKKTLSSPLCRGVIIHEMVHYLQDLGGTLDQNNCNAIAKNEAEAYKVQARYLQHSGYSVPLEVDVELPERCKSINNNLHKIRSGV
jgi:hypothetical protein